jgi:hypothetical protein
VSVDEFLHVFLQHYPAARDPLSCFPNSALLGLVRSPSRALLIHRYKYLSDEGQLCYENRTSEQ